MENLLLNFHTYDYNMDEIKLCNISQDHRCVQRTGGGGRVGMSSEFSGGDPKKKLNVQSYKVIFYGHPKYRVCCSNLEKF